MQSLWRSLNSVNFNLNNTHIKVPPLLFVVFQAYSFCHLFPLNPVVLDGYPSLVLLEVSFVKWELFYANIFSFLN